MDNFRAMVNRTFQLVLHYDGARFCGWQRQPHDRTVQGELERVFEQLMGTPTPVTGAGRTDTGVHARGQAAHVVVPEKWTASVVRRAANALVAKDIWIERVYEMQPHFHARFSATARGYRYHIGTTEMAQSPFRRPYEWYIPHRLDAEVLHEAASMLVGEHTFLGFAVRGTAPETDHHRCLVTTAQWTASIAEGAKESSATTGWVFTIEANRFLHHMVRFLVGTMVDVASGRRTLASMRALLRAANNFEVSPPAPPHGLFLDRVTYPSELYVTDTNAADLNPAHPPGQYSGQHPGQWPKSVS